MNINDDSDPADGGRTSAILMKSREILLWRLSRAQVLAYLSLASTVLAFAALYMTGRVFSLERRDALLFEFERRQQEYEGLLIATDCFTEHVPGTRAPDDEIKALRALSRRLRATFMEKGDASLSELVDVRNDVLTVGSDSVMKLRRYLASERTNIDDVVLGHLVRKCDLQ